MGSRQRRSTSSYVPLALGITAAIVFFVGSGVVWYRNIRTLTGDASAVAHTHEVITSVGRILSLMKDAETGQRGFLITGEDVYLEPLTASRALVEDEIANVERLTAADPAQQVLLTSVKTQVAAKLAELDETVALRRTSGFDAAQDIVRTNRGKAAMEALRSTIERMVFAETRTRAEKVAQVQAASRAATISGLLASAFGIALSITVAVLIHRTLSARRRQEWLHTGRLELAMALSGERQAASLGSIVLDFLASRLGAQAGAFFIRDKSGFKRLATHGVPAESGVPAKFEEGDGLLGKAATGPEVIRLDDVPDGYLTIGSALGRGNPRHLVILPAVSDGVVNAVVEFGFLQPPGQHALDLLAQISEPVGVAVKSALYREHLQELLEETQRQAEELQAQGEELRVSNEELEEQSRALKESQSRLEQQQSELEQTNSQLEEQTQLLEIQRNDLEIAKAAVQAKADELERSGRYKSDFLANMSHELRTPLNSSLILSKLLADNPAGNLTDEQVKYAQTIHSSGNDLLALINDILDLSKIEAGHMEIHPEPITIQRLVADLAQVFEPIAGQKGLSFHASRGEGCPDAIETDKQRLEQILRNLLSNAVKFTEHGSVSLTVVGLPDGRVSFVVKDTGIGIATEHQRDVFEAFRQADGTISRKYGGTGLGLSISRELARLLGGAITLESTPGEGSTFSVVLPGRRDDIQPVAEESRKSSSAEPVGSPVAGFVTDDRESLSVGDRSILVVEDDESFASILRDLAHEMDFRCLMARTAEDALSLAKQYLPNAVLLDVGLPDHSGLSVLDRLKQNTRTRHIPVHVISAEDHSRTALSLGAIGSMLKPVKREDLVDALAGIEARIAGGPRRVLVVEDDAVQRESVTQLLRSGDVEIVAVGTAADCLARLKDSTFDCMVLDLSLPDASGYSLLETLSREEAYSFPPVIVYTGRDLSSAEEQQLRKYSKSIIIKGAKSPERLLDEVTLFLHHVVSELPREKQKMLEIAHNRDAILEGRRILVVEDDVRNIFALTNILEPRGAVVQIARNGREALEALEKGTAAGAASIDLVLMDVMMPEMDGLTATREIRRRPEWRKLPVIMLTAKAMKSDQERCLEAGANDYMAKPLDVEKLLSLVRVWMPR